MQRVRSLKTDQNDSNTFSNMGMSVSNEFYQTVPMFFTREGSQLNLTGQYKGSSIFVIANGPSFASIDKNLLKKPGIMTYGMNNGPKTFRPNFWTCVDDPSRFLKSIWVDPYITKIIPFSHFEKSLFDSNKWESVNIKVGECPNVIGFRRNEKFMANRFLKETTINWGNHKQWGGGRSVLLPVLRICFLLGFRKVYLLGVDFNMSEENTYHFDEQRSNGAVKGNLSTYKRLINEYLPQLKPEFDREGFQVFNCNKDSGLKCFPFMSIEDAVTQAISPLGDVENERTWGLYIKPEERVKYKAEPKPEEKKNLVKSVSANVTPLNHDIPESCANNSNPV